MYKTRIRDSLRFLNHRRLKMKLSKNFHLIRIKLLKFLGASRSRNIPMVAWELGMKKKRKTTKFKSTESMQQLPLKKSLQKRLSKPMLRKINKEAAVTRKKMTKNQ